MFSAHENNRNSFLKLIRVGKKAMSSIRKIQILNIQKPRKNKIGSNCNIT